MRRLQNVFCRDMSGGEMTYFTMLLLPKSKLGLVVSRLLPGIESIVSLNMRKALIIFAGKLNFLKVIVMTQNLYGNFSDTRDW